MNPVIVRSLPGTHLKKFFAGFLVEADPQCLCFKRADLMDVMGCRWCRDNIEYIVDWLEEEADYRKLFEDEELKKRMRRYAERFAKRKFWVPRCVTEFFVRQTVERALAPGEARRILMKRMVFVCIHRAERRKVD